MIRRLICAAAALASLAAGAPSLTTIQDVLYKADGTRFNGTLTVSWNSFQSADNSDIVTQMTTVKVLDGNLRVQLVPSSTATPSIVYSVTYNSDGRIQFQEYWSVPPSATPLRIRDVRVASTGNGASGSGGSGGDPAADTSSITEAQVTGLLADLAARPVKGPALAAGRAAIVDAGGLIESAVGNATDCMHVDGSSGPCGGGAPTFVDADLPGGIVDGSNPMFTLTAVPSPSGSLSVYRNGILMKPAVDYTATGNSIQFVPAATPQPGDMLLASYRVADANGGVSSTYSGYSAAQVLCSGSGAMSSSPMLTNLGACAIPAGLLAAGDRIEIRFDYAHSGAAGGFSIETHWGGTTIVHRDASAVETLLTGRAGVGILASSAQLSSESWGASTAFSVNAEVAADAWANGLTISFLGSASDGADKLTLNNFTVVRLP